MGVPPKLGVLFGSPPIRITVFCGHLRSILGSSYSLKLPHNPQSLQSSDITEVCKGSPFVRNIPTVDGRFSGRSDKRYDSLEAGHLGWGRVKGSWFSVWVRHSCD